MPSIDLGKLVQASISKQIQENSEYQTPTSGVNLDNLDTSMAQTYQKLNQEGFGDVGINSTSDEIASAKAKAAAAARTKMDDVKDLARSAGSKISSGVNAVNDEISARPGVAAGVAAGAGLLGAGLAARKYLARKKK